MTLQEFLEGIQSASGDDLLFLGLPALAGLVLVVVALLAGDGSDAKRQKRISRIKGDGPKKAATAQAISIRKTTTDSDIKFLDALIKRSLPKPDLLRTRLERAGLKISLGVYLLINLVVGGTAAAASTLSGFIPLPAILLIGFFVGLGLPHLAVGFLGKRRRARFIAYFPEAIDLMVRGLKSGLPITESIKVAAEEIPNPVGSELQQVTDEVKMGAKVDAALEAASRRLDIQEFNYLTIALSIQAETGGNLAETLENLSDVLRKRRAIKLKIKALSSEAKASAYIIGALPFVMAFMIHITNQHYLVPLVEDSRGHLLVMLGLTSFAMGAGVMYKMVKFEI